MKTAPVLLATAIAATSAVALWAILGGDPPTATEPQAKEKDGVAAPTLQVNSKPEAAALPSLPAGNTLPTLAQAQAPLPEAMAKVEAVPFAPNHPSTDFSHEAAKGHDPKAMRALAAQFETWTKSPANASAQVEFGGVDCRQAPCVMALKFNADRDGGLLGRAEAWLSAQGGVGKVMSVTHRLGADHLREWFFFNPHPEASKEHHLYEQAAIARIQAEKATLPGQVDPSAALSARDRERDLQNGQVPAAPSR